MSSRRRKTSYRFALPRAVSGGWISTELEILRVQEEFSRAVLAACACTCTMLPT